MNETADVYACTALVLGLCALLFFFRLPKMPWGKFSDEELELAVKQSLGWPQWWDEHSARTGDGKAVLDKKERSLAKWEHWAAHHIKDQRLKRSFQNYFALCRSNLSDAQNEISKQTRGKKAGVAALDLAMPYAHKRLLKAAKKKAA